MRDSLASVVGVWGKEGAHRELREPAAKRISTPAGQRLSVILGSGGETQKQARSAAHRSSVRRSGLPAEIANAPRESEETSNKSSGYSYTVWSDGEKWSLKGSRNIARRVGWKRILIILAIIIAGVVALAVGIALGLKKKPSSSNAEPQLPPPASPTQIDEDTPELVVKPTATGTLAAPSATPSNFPIGSYSIVTFLDTIQTNCTSNPLTWTCHPDTIYNSDPAKAVATFDWIISSSSDGKLRISSPDDNVFGIAFKNTDLKLYDEGTDSERYRFQLSTLKSVTPVKPLGKDGGGEVECGFPDTSLAAFLYTRMARSYPDLDKGQPTGDPKYPVWPYAVRVEQSAAGGPSVPSCHNMSNGEATGDAIEGLAAEDANGLCSCLYKNWRTPGKY